MAVLLGCCLIPRISEASGLRLAATTHRPEEKPGNPNDNVQAEIKSKFNAFLNGVISNVNRMGIPELYVKRTDDMNKLKVCTFTCDEYVFQMLEKLYYVFVVKLVLEDKTVGAVVGLHLKLKYMMEWVMDPNINKVLLPKDEEDKYKARVKQLKCIFAGPMASNSLANRVQVSIFSEAIRYMAILFILSNDPNKQYVGLVVLYHGLDVMAETTSEKYAILTIVKSRAFPSATSKRYPTFEFMKDQFYMNNAIVDVETFDLNYANIINDRIADSKQQYAKEPDVSNYAYFTSNRAPQRQFNLVVDIQAIVFIALGCAFRLPDEYVKDKMQKLTNQFNSYYDNMELNSPLTKYTDT